MKRFMILLLCLALVAATVVTTAFASTTKATVSSASGKPGETVSLTVSLAGFEKANSVAVEITADSALQLKSEGSQWLLTDGLLTDVDVANKKAVWTAVGAVDVNKGVLKLSFVIPQLTAGQSNFSYAVTCKVMVKNNAQELGTETATGYITMSNPAKGLTLDKSSLTLDLVSAKEATLTATVTPADSTDAVVWSSSNTAVATVVNGKVTAVGKGSATIKATCGSYTRSCSVTVKCATHDLKEVAAKPATCQATGNKLYYICNACQGVFNANKVATTVAAQTIAKTGHAGGTATCQSAAICATCSQPYGNKASHAYASTWSTSADKHWQVCANCPEKRNEKDHVFQWKVDKEPTEDATGLKHEECTTCKYKRNENTVVPVKDHEHRGITYHAAVTANCTREGNVKYYTCADHKCAGKYYSDSKCYNEITTGVVIPKDPAKHTGGTELKGKVAATCNAEGYTGDTYCKGCGQVSKAGTVIPATGKHVGTGDYLLDGTQHWRLCTCGTVTDKANHTMEWVTDKAATETETGLKHEECKVCKLKANENTVMEKLEHKPEKVTAKEPTCTEAGYIEHYFCPNCSVSYASTNGKMGAVVKADDLTLSATGHTFATEWASDGSNHWHVCACGEKGDVAAHTTELQGVVAATQDTPGYSGDAVCTVCKAVVSQGEEIPAISEQVPETTQAAQPTQPTQSGVAAEPFEEDTDGNLALILILIGVAAAAAFALAIVLKKRKK